ncbi:glutamate racemase [Anthocerotibacter panamensis]|uniref:glutamate racemase n=1 Tax=Anthocerotibacter panamensis TaxID=2857077 RepID=UPI001C4078E1|nr:glutamate racemase [Anthocerotibacter panamensis]
MNSAARFPIGVFDSGLGGLTVLRQIQTQLPQEPVIYFADTARVPYGSRPTWEIEQFVRQIVQWLLKERVKMVIMACHTGSALVLEQLRGEVPVPIVGILLPGARQAVSTLHQQTGGQGRRIGILATEGTVRSRAFERAVLEAEPRALVQAVACPEFVPWIERGAYRLGAPGHAELREVVASYLEPLQDWPLETLVYGCTHYPLLEPLIRERLGRDFPCVDPAVPTVAAAAQELIALGLTHQGPARYRFCVTGDPEQFLHKARPFLPVDAQIEQVHLPVSAVVQPEE